MINELIEMDPRRCNGKPVIAGARIPVTVILDQLADSGSVDAVLRKYPELTRDMVNAALRFCHDLIDRTEMEPEHA